jgi:hypothetical protein
MVAIFEVAVNHFAVASAFESQHEEAVQAVVSE